MTKPKETLIHQIIAWSEVKPHEGAIYGRKPGGQFEEHSWRKYLTAIRDAGKGLIALGVKPGESVAIVGANRPEWVISEFGIMCARGIVAPIYVTNTPEQVAYIVSHSQAKVGFCDNEENLAKYREAQASGSIKLETIITMDAIDEPVEGVKMISLSELMELGKQQSDEEIDRRIDGIDPDETCLLIYTSGTTGTPKAVELSHGGCVMMGEALVDRVPALRGNYRSISYLPLCHIAEQAFTNILALQTGGKVYFCPDMLQIKDFLTAVRPTIFLGVPRVWEKFEAALRKGLGEATGLKAMLATWAMKTEHRCFHEEVSTGRPVNSLSRRIARKLVIGKIQNKLGLDQLLLAATGAAPIALKTQEFFASIGICLLEGYGMSETTAALTAGDPDKPCFGSVGRALKGVTLKIADDGEILAKGRNITKGYLHMPEQTAELFDADGWLCTGDLGSIDKAGNLRITGRKKDILITAGGKNVGPVEIESHLLSIPGVGQALVIGDRQPYLSALITLDAENLPALCRKLGIAEGSVETVAKASEIRAYLGKCIEQDCNPKLAQYQTVKRFEVLSVEFTVEGGELTPTMKTKRNVITEKYADVIAGIYAKPREGNGRAIG